MDNNISQAGGVLDRAAVLLSGLCMLHCLALPLAIAGIPFLSGLATEHFHLQMLAIVMPVSSVALWLGYRRHGELRIVLWGISGMLVLLLGATVAHTTFGLLADRVLSIIGSLVLAAVHFFNYRFSRQCVTDYESAHS